jgi:hypothetical protein
MMHVMVVMVMMVDVVMMMVMMYGHGLGGLWRRPSRSASDCGLGERVS